jgi:hypothetical protein
MHADTDIVAPLTKLASDYGPFLFAILFALVVPFRAYQNYSDCTGKYPQPTGEQCELIKQTELYFRSAWIAGFVLVAFSVAWWLYFNWDRLHVAQQGYRVSYEGEIRGVTADDKLDVGLNSPVFLSFNNSPPRYTFHVLTQAPISAPIPVQLVWVSEQQTAAQQSGYDGSQFVSFRFDPKTTEYQLKKNGTILTIQAVPGN